MGGYPAPDKGYQVGTIQEQINESKCASKGGAVVGSYDGDNFATDAVAFGICESILNSTPPGGGDFGGFDGGSSGGGGSSSSW